MEPEGEGRPLLSLQDLESRLVFTRCKVSTEYTAVTSGDSTCYDVTKLGVLPNGVYARVSIWIVFLFASTGYANKMRTKEQSNPVK
jgi:hypothetical protein